jgi:hypothetical protein
MVNAHSASGQAVAKAQQVIKDSLNKEKIKSVATGLFNKSKTLWGFARGNKAPEVEP